MQRAAKRLLAAAPALAARWTTAEVQPKSTRASTPMPGPPTRRRVEPQRVFSAVFPTPAPTVFPQPSAPRPEQLMNVAPLPQPLARSVVPRTRSLMASQAAATLPTAGPGHARPPLAPTNRQAVLPPSPGWPACSPGRARAASEDASSPVGQGLHVLAADVREAVSGGLSGRLSKSLESLLFVSSGGCSGGQGAADMSG